MITWKSLRGDGAEFYWEGTPFEEYVDARIYDVNWGRDTETDENTPPWLIWDPPQESQTDELPEEVWFVKALEQSGYFQPWQPFRERTGFEEGFRPTRFYGDMEKRRAQRRAAFSKMCDRFGVDTTKPVSPAKVPGLRAIRDQARERLEKHAGQMQKNVMGPLRHVMIPCAIEAGRVLTNFQALDKVDEETREKWWRTIRDLSHLWQHGVGDGFAFDLLHGHENWYGRTFEHVPDPVAAGAKAALRTYVESNYDTFKSSTRDDILATAEPVYFQWEAARQMLGSALYEWSPAGYLENNDSTSENGPPEPTPPRRTHEELIEDATEEEKKLARIGLRIYENGDYDSRTSLLKDMEDNEEVVDLVGATYRRKLIDQLGPLYIEAEPSRSPEEEQKKLLNEMIQLWSDIPTE